MRTTVTLDDDVRAMIEQLQEDEGLTFKEAVNRALRQGLYQSLAPQRREPYQQRGHRLGKAYVNLDDIGEVLAVAEGEEHR